MRDDSRFAHPDARPYLVQWEEEIYDSNFPDKLRVQKRATTVVAYSDEEALRQIRRLPHQPEAEQQAHDLNMASKILFPRILRRTVVVIRPAAEWGSAMAPMLPGWMEIPEFEFPYQRRS